VNPISLWTQTVAPRTAIAQGGQSRLAKTPPMRQKSKRACAFTLDIGIDQGAEGNCPYAHKADAITAVSTVDDITKLSSMASGCFLHRSWPTMRLNEPVMRQVFEEPQAAMLYRLTL
jgi:hypothetical protein